MAEKYKPVIVKKPWGEERIFASVPELYLGKILVINKGARLSLQYHTKKHETLYVLRGKCLMEIKGKKTVYNPGEGAPIPTGVRHRFSAPYGKVTLLEVSTYHPNDTVRLSDDYKRKNETGA
jgi:mannose-6-phosphate isomerase-like protein (cupin superfamily)